MCLNRQRHSSETARETGVLEMFLKTFIEIQERLEVKHEEMRDG